MYAQKEQSPARLFATNGNTAINGNSKDSEHHMLPISSFLKVRKALGKKTMLTHTLFTNQTVELKKEKGILPTNDYCVDSSFRNLYSRENTFIGVNSITKTSDGNELICGVLSDTILTPFIYYPFIAKVDAKGVLLWVKEYHNNISDWFSFYSLYETLSGDIIAAGEHSTLSPDPASSYYYTDIVRLTNDGDIIWNKSLDSKLLPGSKYSLCKAAPPLFIRSIKEAPGGDFIFCGTTYGCPSPMFATVFKTDKNGSFQWDTNIACQGIFTQGIGAIVKGSDILMTCNVDNKLFKRRRHLPIVF